MAEAAVRFLVEKLGALIVQEAINLHEGREQVEWLKREMGRMQCFLKDADAKKNNGDDERVKNWVTEMRDLAFEAEDIIDTFMYVKLRRQQPGCMGFMKRFVFIFHELVSRRKVHVDVQGIKTKLKELSESRARYGISNIGTTSQSRSPGGIPILPELIDDIDMVGFDDEKKKIGQELVDTNDTNRSVISIVGMGGLGKTTLAKSVYNDYKVKRSFDILAWVTISQQYIIPEILKGILSDKSETSSEDTIQTLSIKVCEKLKKGKYLVVLDDVWTAAVWNELRKVFPDVNNGSRVIVTTRFENVISIADALSIADPTTKLHKLRYLNEKESWELFLRKVFPRQDIETCCPACLLDYAHLLVQRCGGLPLALVVLGGLVSTKRQTRDEWHKVVDSTKGQFVESGERCLEVLALSYNDLPYYLKSCFLYFGCFKEDEEIPAKTLIRLWLAEGFLPKKNSTTTEEEIGSDCLKELAQRCLIQVIELEYDDSAKRCRIHDLLRDMCISEARESRFLKLYKNDTEDCPTTANAARQLIIFNEIETLNYSNSKLRGLFYGSTYNGLPFRALKGQLGIFKLLRVLLLSSSELDISEFPSEIKSLIHLRYLDLKIFGLKEVPSWIGHLRNLQTFILSCGGIEKISDSLWTIGNLGHVELPYSSSVPPPNMGNNVPKNLQTLEGVNAGSWIGSTLPKLENLCELSIRKVSNDHAGALSSSLQKLGRLASFSIVDGDEIHLDNIITAFSNQHCLKKLVLFGILNRKQLPHNDVFPQQLVEIYLSFSGLEQDPMATLEKLPCLKYLRLIDAYRGKQMICSATGFPQLLSLEIGAFHALEEWTIEENAMLCLKSLEIDFCKNLKMIPEGLKNVPLDLLQLGGMPKEFVTRIEENTGEDWYKIQHVPNIPFNLHMYYGVRHG
ncbi:probable disease resistance RPP8-like protein 2 [Dioscorea cayenensis subsp. rotundata]|uniref:Probable disease resistance RPP8-like protein 2 n=1 Tax=Dioscorea cayennensis subsp. rotundata TaxID=55577 RepID=A0AB40AX97_DIOCR|nr:probable disease resistance RPP8-like protein 2 [Dioscorea cayenensis subsp. rotundata]XP_039119665.1 probable disease resistance RPP8-like protein 2 [Dioscorea cayenensis subsp. rotundata]